MKKMIALCSIKKPDQMKMVPEDIIQKKVQFQEGKLGIIRNLKWEMIKWITH